MDRAKTVLRVTPLCQHGPLPAAKSPRPAARLLLSDGMKEEIEYQHPERKILRDWDASRVK